MAASSNRATAKLKSLLGTDRTINEQPHGPVHLTVERGARAFAKVEIENSEGSWRAHVDQKGVVEDITPSEYPDWVAFLLINLGFDVPDAPVTPH